TSDFCEFIPLILHILRKVRKNVHHAVLPLKLSQLFALSRTFSLLVNWRNTYQNPVCLICQTCGCNNAPIDLKKTLLDSEHSSQQSAGCHFEEVVFSCGCEIRWLQLWQQRGEAGLGSQDLYCTDGFKKILLQEMNISSCDFPDISVSHSNLTVIEGDRVTAICNGSGSPLPEVDWPVNGLHSISSQE
ncbi:NT-3 growth factor receptor-like, partial [Solea senegalensis]